MNLLRAVLCWSVTIFIMTPHLGAIHRGSTGKSITIAEEVISVLTGGTAKNAINIPSVKPEVMRVLAPYIGLAETMADVCAQLLGTSYEKVEISYNGEIAEKDTRPVTVAALKGMLQNALGSSVNYVNAPALARSRKIEVIESKSETSGERASEIQIKLE
jgi:D-3-phosphoglycerate dehydrogenase